MAPVQGIGDRGLLCEWAPLMGALQSGLGVCGNSGNSHPSARCSKYPEAWSVRDRAASVASDVSCVVKILKFFY